MFTFAAAHARPMLHCPKCRDDAVMTTGWLRHEGSEQTRNFFVCSSCYLEFYVESDVLSTCALAALSVYDKCLLYSSIDNAARADQLILEVKYDDPTDS